MNGRGYWRRSLFFLPPTVWRPCRDQQVHERELDRPGTLTYLRLYDEYI